MKVSLKSIANTDFKTKSIIVICQKSGSLFAFPQILSLPASPWKVKLLMQICAVQKYN